jgi:RNA polymerase sigma factor (TIGR02999 family)
MSSSSPEEITLLLKEWRGGSPAAEKELWPILYRELKRLARGVLRGGAGRRRLGTTTLVHEAYLRLLGPAASSLEWNDRGHFFAVAARAMRFVLIDEARRRLSAKRDGEDTRAEIPEDRADPLHQPPEDVLAVHGALERLAKIHPRYEQLVEMRYFAGLSVDETAEALGVSRPTVVRDWRAARTWLYGELQA